MHSERHETWLSEMVARNGDVLPFHAARELEECEHCAARLVELRRVRRALDAAADEHDEVLAAARDQDDAPGVARAQEWIRDNVPALASAAAHRRADRRRFVAAAALLGVAASVAWFVRGARSRPDGTREVLDGGELRALAPLGPGSLGEEFRWSAAPDAGGWCVVRVYAPGAVDASLESERLAASSWSADAATLERLPDEVEWQVTMYDSTGAVSRVSALAWASRR